MVAGNRELFVGLKRDPVFGPVVAFGLGGVMTEVFKDIALARVPLTDRDVSELLDSIRATRILGAFRGAPAVDRTALGSIIRAVAQIAVDFPEIAEIDINPLLVEGSRPVAADALVILDAEGAAEAPRPAAGVPVPSRSTSRRSSAPAPWPSSGRRMTPANGAARY